MMMHHRNPQRFESRRRRRNDSVLQMVQGLEICNSTLQSAMTSKRPCLRFDRCNDLELESSTLFVMPEAITCCEYRDTNDDCNDDDTFVSAVSGTSPSESGSFAVCDKPFEIGIVTPPKERQPRASSRRRRSRQQSSHYDSDFCNNDLACQIEAMVLGVETVYENRHLKESKTTPDHCFRDHFLSSIENSINKVIHPEPAVSTAEVRETLNVPPSTLRKCRSQDKMLENTRDTSASRMGSGSSGILHRLFQTPQSEDEAPAMISSDSFASLSSAHSTSSHSSMDLLTMTPVKKTGRLPAQRNAEWEMTE